MPICPKKNGRGGKTKIADWLADHLGSIAQINKKQNVTQIALLM